MKSSTSRATRIAIWAIAIVMVAGFIGSYFLFTVEQDNQTDSVEAWEQQLQEQQNQAASEHPVDPTAYTVDGMINELQITDLRVGAGKEAGPDDLLRIHYKGTFAQTGQKFDSSYDRGDPLTCTLGGLIAGWQQGIPGMREDGKRRLVIPYELAYGETGSLSIPPSTDLVFEVELLSVNPQGGVDQCAAPQM